MTRHRLATVLAVLAGLMVVGTTAAAVASYLQRPTATSSYDARGSVLVSDPASGASFEVPVGWSVKERRLRIWYADADGRPQALVRGPAVYREGYCSARPARSNRGFAGFTRQGLGAWRSALARSAGVGSWTVPVSRTSLTLADGTVARLASSSLPVGDSRRCSSPSIAISMVSASVGGRPVRLVLVRDTAAPGTLTDREAIRVLATLRLADG